MKSLQRNEIPVVYDVVVIANGMRKMLQPKKPIWATGSSDAIAKAIAYCRENDLPWIPVDAIKSATGC